MAGHIFIYGGIGTDVRQHEISAQDVRNQIDENKSESELVVHIISPGGDVFEGEAIYNALRNTGKKITTHVEGTCASIATLIAAAGDKIIMNKTARFMIHNPKITGMQSAADSRDLRHVADQLDQIKTLLINVYEIKTKLGKEKLWELYDNETWLTADEAEKMGFIDESVDAIKAVATVNLNKFKNASFNVGDEVTVKDGAQHDPGHSNMVMTISEISTPAIAVKMPDGEIHKWYTESELNLKNNKMKNQSLWAKFANMLSTFKNAFTEALADGRVIIVESEDEDWTGKKVSFEDGTPVPAGDHQLASGKVISVDDQGSITKITEAEAPADKQQNEEMDNKIKELEAQLAEAKSAKETAEANAKASHAQAAGAEARALKFENRVSAIEKDFLKLKEEAGMTVGDTKDLPKGPVIKNVNQDERRDPMGDFVLQELKNRNLVK